MNTACRLLLVFRVSTGDAGAGGAEVLIDEDDVLVSEADTLIEE